MIGEYNTRQQSTHVTRDRVSGDKRLENLLDRWGDYRRTGAVILSYGPESCVVPITERMANNKNYTYEETKKIEIQLEYERQGLTGRVLTEAVRRAFNEYKRRIDELNQPKETIVRLHSSPTHYSEKDMIQANKAIAELHRTYRNMLIRKYEDEWTSADFLREWKWDVDKTRKTLYKAREAAKHHKKIAILLGRA